MAEEDAFDGVEPLVLPRGHISPEVVAQQVVVEEGLILLVREVRLHDRVEEGRVFLREEEAQFVAGVLAVERLLFLRLQLRPVQKERELGHLRAVRQRRIQGVEFRKRVVRLEAAARGVFERERLPGREDADGLLLREVALRVEPGPETQVQRPGRGLGQRDRFHDRVQRIDGDGEDD